MDIPFPLYILRVITTKAFFDYFYYSEIEIADHILSGATGINGAPIESYRILKYSE